MIKNILAGLLLAVSLGAQAQGIFNNGPRILPGTATLTGTESLTNKTVNGHTLANPTQQVFLTGSSATYNRPAGVTQIRVTMKGGGGGGAGNGTTSFSSTNGAAGGTTTFNSVNAVGGGGAQGSSGIAGAGGTGGTGTANWRMSGAPGGMYGFVMLSATNAELMGASGGGAGGGAGGLFGAAGGNAVANTGGGGGSAGLGSLTFATLATFAYAGGGGEGETALLIINSPSATYTYTVGSAGTKGAATTSGFAGGDGGTGIIIVDEYY